MSQNCFTRHLWQLVEAANGHEGWIRNCVSPLWDGGDVAFSSMLYEHVHVRYFLSLIIAADITLSPVRVCVRYQKSRIASRRQRQRSWLSGCTPELGRTTEAGLLESCTIWTYKDLRICGRKDIVMWNEQWLKTFFCKVFRHVKIGKW